MKRKVIKRVITTVIFLALFLPILNVVYVWSKGCCNNGDIQRTLSANMSEAIESKSIIAILKPDINKLPELIVERYKIKEPYKYPFISYQSFSDDYTIKIALSDSLIFIGNSNDTLNPGGLYNINKMPETMEIFTFSGKKIGTYRPEKIFTDNIKNKPTISFWNMLTWGPTTAKCLNECN